MSKLAALRIWGSLGNLPARPASVQNNEYTMSVRNGISILRRHGSTSRSFSSCQQRLTSSRDCEPFVLPRLVIDLDAAESTLVKRWEDMTAEENGGQNAPISKGARKQRNLHRDAKPRRVRIDGSQQQRSHIDSIMPCDMLSFAILGHPAAQPPSESRALNNVYRRCGIKEQDSYEVVFQHLATTYSADLTLRPTQAGILRNVKEDLSRMIETCKNFSKLKRTVTMLSSTLEGCRFLVQHEKSVLRGIRLCRFASKNESASQENMVSYAMVLKMLNNLKISMESRGMEVSSDLCNAGIYYASKVPSLPAVKEYLEISLLNFYPANAHTTLGLMQMQQLCQTGGGDGERLLLHPSGKDVLNLITGLREGLDPRQIKERDVSFASLLYGEAGRPRGLDVDPRLYFTYVQGLGELGHGDALWEEFESGKTHLPQSVRSEKHKVYVARSFALACMAAGDSKRALSILHSVRQFSDPEASDEEETSLRSIHYRWLVSALDTHYRSRNLSPTKHLGDKIEEEFRNLPSDPEQTIEIFEKFIVKKAMLHVKGATVPAGNLNYRQR